MLSFLSGAATIVVLAFPFAIGRGYGWLPELYLNTLSSYPYASLNAFNLMALLGGNFVEMSQTVLHMTYQAIGTTLMAASLLYCCYLYIRSKGREGALFYVTFLFITAMFVCTAKMHERYLHYGLLLVLVAYIYLKDKRMLMLFIGFSLTHFINVGDVLLRSFHQDYHIPKDDPLLLVVSALNVLLFIYACMLGWRHFVKPHQLSPQQGQSPLQRDLDGLVESTGTTKSTESIGSAESTNSTESTNSAESRVQAPNIRFKSWTSIFEPSIEEKAFADKRRLFTGKDVLYLGALIVVYTFIALYHLGGHQDPATFWKPARSGEAIIADLGAEHQITRINSFAGVGEGAYSYWFSKDGQAWEHQIAVKSDHTQVFTWHTEEPKVQARYVKIAIDAQESAALHLHEVGIFGEESSTILPVQEVIEEQINTEDEGNGASLFDEPQVVPYKPTYMEGSYFDEIYHARTAYEHLHKIEPYESTHPPLGKILISIGIWLFGLNPFGWRIIGTLFGVGMIPIMYVFAKRMFGKSEYAFIAAFLLTFDFMHFAQTRIATIDVYGVFFIMLMFYFMYRYTTRSFYRDGLWKTLIPLGLSGLFFGIGAASKWIVIYGGAGLALLLFLTLLERYREYRLAKRVLNEAYEPDTSLHEHTASLDHGSGGEEADQALTNARQPETALTDNTIPPREFLTEEQRRRLQNVIRQFPRYTISTLLYCLLTFVLIPVVIYTLSYIPFMMVPGPGHGLKDVVTYQVHMYKYHKDLVATHPFSSPWWEWPMMIRPIWYYQGKLMPPGMLSSIVSFGNPLIWWPGFIAVIVSIYVAAKRLDKKLVVLLIAYGSQYLPWMLVPRLTFIYHYFAMVPFMVLLLTYYIKGYLEESESPHKRKWVSGYLVGVFILFALFYPILSGMVIPSAYSYYLRWLPGWNFSKRSKVTESITKQKTPSCALLHTAESFVRFTVSESPLRACIPLLPHTFRKQTQSDHLCRYTTGRPRRKRRAPGSRYRSTARHPQGHPESHRSPDLLKMSGVHRS
ncbi:glycosyltransferase family 39 protein [Paenibacillus hexagrammi]|uniref:Glycosyltransferase family 39 protein n=1 Tax=Paenibacillus hexagrammi TaxID=2908839 RepID=A0ABY3SKD9_9BACL|nr:glycosyltransferase family 39 protein [Paenibacillus sp. YPD9-1]UJF34508.1 glycosyltransferase family 39 protein [Paenibacillus sp. YPD9-1]